MKYLLFLSICLLVLSFDEPLEIRQSPACVAMEPNPDFVSIPFKEDYTIQLPAGYSGEGINMSESVSFNVKTPNGSQLGYSYSCAADCIMYFGQPLESPAPDTIRGMWGYPYEALVKATQFCLDGEIEAILYHSAHAGPGCQGWLYMKRGQDFEEGLRLQFDYGNFSEIEAILQSISKQ